jgi:hypothetical protein
MGKSKLTYKVTLQVEVRVLEGDEPLTSGQLSKAVGHLLEFGSMVVCSASNAANGVQIPVVEIAGLEYLSAEEVDRSEPINTWPVNPSSIQGQIL